MQHSNLLGCLQNLEVQAILKPLKDVTSNKRLLEIAVCGLATFGVVYLGKLWRAYGFFKKRGIPTPPYTFFYGNLPELIEKGCLDALADWTRKYGKTYGYFEGHLPILVTTDLEMIEEIYFKQFSNFSARKMAQQQLADDSLDVNVFLASRTRWKRLRTISNQTFSPAKLKEMLPLMRSCSDRLIIAISKNLSKELNISELMNQNAMDLVWNCMFGIDIDLINNPDFVYYKKILEISEGFVKFDLFMKLTTYVYEFKPVIVGFSFLTTLISTVFGLKGGNAFFWLLRQVGEVVDERNKQNASKSQRPKKNDFVQLLLDAEADKINLDFDNEQYESENTKIIQKKMTRREILLSILGFMFAGFDTTSSTLQFCLYTLMTHPEELAKLQDEADSLTEFDYESINRLEYLDLFIKEVLRMYPVGAVVQNRRCTKATTLKGIDIPENLVIAVDVLSLHYDRENWPGVDPDEFYPLRFASNSSYNKLAYMPFGAGARTCIGMRFALLEIKLVLMKIVKKFDMATASPLPLKPVIKDGFMNVRKPQQPVKIIFNERTN